MQLTNLFDENDGSRAVSPVIGVILMVAITVILAAVIGTFVLGLGDNVESAPQASIDFEDGTSGSNSVLNISHRGGDNLNTDNIEVRVNGEEVDGGSTDTGFGFEDGTAGDGTETIIGATGDSFTAGESLTVAPDSDATSTSNFAAGDQIDVIAAGTDSDNVIASFEYPS